MSDEINLNPELQQRLERLYGLRDRWERLKRSKFANPNEEYFDTSTDFQIEQAIGETVSGNNLPQGFNIDELENFIKNKGF